MIRESLFASSERESKLNKHGDVLQDLERRIDFSAITLGSSGKRIRSCFVH